MTKVRFWGTRGSLPVSLMAADIEEKMVRALLAARGANIESENQARQFVGTLPFELRGTFGGNTSCVQIEPDNLAGAREYIVCDLGSGIRPFGADVMSRNGADGNCTFHIFLSHLHWDHIMGLPFFVPAYVPGNRLRFYGCHSELRYALERQQAPPSFPVPLSTFKADLEFVQLVPGQSYPIAGMNVTAMKQIHTGDSYGFRFERNGSSLVYSTDSEHKLEDKAHTESVVEFFRQADAVIFDAMYSLADAISVKEDWGHSSNMLGVELCQRAGARQLYLFHHEPVNSDSQIREIESETCRLEELTRETGPKLDVFAAYDGMEFSI